MNFEVYNLTWLLILSLLAFIAREHFARYYIGNGKSRKRLAQEIGGILVTGTFLPLLTGLFTFYLLVIIIGSLAPALGKAATREKKLRAELSRPSQIHLYLGTGILVTLTVLVFALYIFGVLGRLFSLDLYFPVTTLGGILVGVVLWAKTRSQPPHTSFTIPTRAKKGLLLLLLVVPSVQLPLIYLPVWNHSQVSPEGLSLTVMTYNILNSGSDGTEKAWPTRSPGMVAYLNATSPDVLGLQEAYQVQIDFLLAGMTSRNYSYYGVGREDGNKTGEQAAILYDGDRFRMEDNGTFWTSPTPSLPSKDWFEANYRICSWVRLRELATDTTFYFYCTHYGFMPWHQTRAGILINEHIAAHTGNDPVILVGDFNMLNFYPFYLYLEGFGPKPLQSAYRLTHGLVNPFDGTSAPTQNIKTDVGFHIDRILVSQHVHVHTCEVHRGTYDGVYTFSDHHPVVVECSIP